MSVFDTYYRYVQLLHYYSGRSLLFLLICLVTQKAADLIFPSQCLNRSGYKCVHEGTVRLAGITWQAGGSLA